MSKKEHRNPKYWTIYPIFILVNYIAMEDNSTDYRDRLKQYRESINMRANKFAEENDIDVSAYAKVEKKQRGLPVEKILDISSKYGLSLDWLYKGIIEANEAPRAEMQQPGADDPALKTAGKMLTEVLTEMREDRIVMRENANAAKEAAQAAREAVAEMRSSYDALQQTGEDHRVMVEAIRLYVVERFAEVRGKNLDEEWIALNSRLGDVEPRRKTGTSSEIHKENSH